MGNGLINFSERSEQCPPYGRIDKKISERSEHVLPMVGRLTKLSERGEHFLPVGSRLTKLSERGEPFLPCGQIDKISGEQRKLKEWGFFTSLLFLYGRPMAAARGTRSPFRRRCPLRPPARLAARRHC